MKNLLYWAMLALAVSLAACAGSDKTAEREKPDPHFDMTFVSTYNDANVARADSALAILDSISATNRAYLALFYAQSSDESFENSQRYMENAIKAYKSAMAADTASVNRAFEAFGREYDLTTAAIHAAFLRNEEMLKGEPVPEMTLEEAIDSIQ